MGMICTLYRAPDTTLQALLNEPEYFSDLTRLGDPPISYEVPLGLMGRIFGRKPKIMQIGHDQLPFPMLNDEDRHSVEKNWHVLHFLMTGTAGEVPGPLGFFLGGGALIGMPHLHGDGVPRAFFAAETRALATALARTSTETLRARFDWPEMMRQEVYPTIVFDGPIPHEFLQGYLGQFGHLRDFLTATIALNRGMVVSYS